MEATSAPPKRIAVGNVINETFSIYGANLGPLIGSALVVFIIVGIIAGILQAVGGLILAILSSVVLLAGEALYVGFVVKLVEDVRDGRRDMTMSDLFSAAAPSILPLIAFGILFGLGVGIGLVLIIVPGLILLTIWAVGAPAIVAEGAGPIEAFGRSRRLVKGNGWSVFGSLLLTLIIVVLVRFVLLAIASGIGNGAIVVASIVAGALTAPIFALAVTVIFFDLGGGSGEAPSAPAIPEPATEPPPPPAPPAPPAS
jgi:hypothetical protein